jgi:hypothetical protein
METNSDVNITRTGIIFVDQNLACSLDSVNRKLGNALRMGLVLIVFHCTMKINKQTRKHIVSEKGESSEGLLTRILTVCHSHPSIANRLDLEHIVFGRQCIKRKIQAI